MAISYLIVARNGVLGLALAAAPIMLTANLHPKLPQALASQAETMAPITPVPRVASQTGHTVRKQPPAPTPMVMAWHQMGRFPAHSVH
jgi:hypothetical protein